MFKSDLRAVQYRCKCCEGSGEILPIFEMGFFRCPRCWGRGYIDGLEAARMKKDGTWPRYFTHETFDDVFEAVE